MRVVVNQTAALGRKTGVGHYTSELLRCLAAQMNEDRLDVYPGGWMGYARGIWDRARTCLADTPPDQQPAPSAACAPVRTSLRQGVLNCIRLTGQKVLGKYFHSRYRRTHYDLYHEPNFIPLPIDLPTVATLHDLSVLLHPEWHPASRVAYFERHFQRGLAQCVHFLTPTEFCRQEVIRVLNIPPERTTCTYEGTRPGLRPMSPEDVAPRLARLGLPPRYLLYLGTIEPRKNLLLLLRAYCSLTPTLRNSCPLLLAGGWGWNTGPVAAYFHSEARHRGVIHLGYVADKHLPVIYNGALALTFPSYYEGFGLPPLEMMACGGAVLSSTAGALAEVVGRRAHLIHADDFDGWRDALARVIEDDDWRQTLRRGTVEAARPFTWERCAADTLRVYRRVCGVDKEVREPGRRAA